MKKFVNALLVFVCCFFMVGCFEQSKNPQKLITKQTSYDIWQYYYDLENSNNFVLGQISKQNDEKMIVFLNNDEKMHFLSNALRDTIATIDVFNKGETIALFQYDSLKDYKVTQLIAGKKYNVSYLDFFKRNLIDNADSDVEKSIFEIGLKVDNEITIEKSDGGVYSARIVQKCTLSDDIQSENQSYIDAENNKITLSRQVSQFEVGSGTNAYTKTIITVSKEIKNSQGNVKKYVREIEFFKQSNVNYMKDSVTAENVTKTQTYRLDNTFSSISIKFVPEIGYLCYEMQYNLNGRVKLYGESYFQGIGSFIQKIFVEILQGEPFGIENSFTIEQNIRQNDFEIKAILKNAKNFDLREQDIQKFAKYNGEENCVCVKKDEQKLSVMVYN